MKFHILEHMGNRMEQLLVLVLLGPVLNFELELGFFVFGNHMLELVDDFLWENKELKFLKIHKK
jgi:hypothetical protein